MSDDGSILAREMERGNRGMGNAFKRISRPLLVRTSFHVPYVPLRSIFIALSQSHQRLSVCGSLLKLLSCVVHVSLFCRAHFINEGHNRSLSRASFGYFLC